MQNPTRYSNWVLSNSETGSFLLQGSYPYTDSRKRKNQLDVLLQMGVNVYVNLCQYPENQRFGDYSTIVSNDESTSSNLDDEMNGNEMSNVRFYWCPIPDMDVTTDWALDDIVDKIVYELVVNNARIFVHCKGGHGRSSTVNSCVLMRLYQKYDAEWAMTIIRERHSTRTVNSHFPVPHGQNQINQVRRYALRHSS